MIIEEANKQNQMPSSCGQISGRPTEPLRGQCGLKTVSSVMTQGGFQNNPHTTWSLRWLTPYLTALLSLFPRKAKEQME